MLEMLFVHIGLLVLVFLAILIIAVILNSYKKVAPNEVLLVTGALLTGPYVQENKDTNTRIKVVKGGGTFVIPIVQQGFVQSLDTFNVDVDVRNVMTKGMVKVNASANAVLRVGSTPDMIATASEKILGLDEEERENQMKQVVYGGVREVLSGLTPQEANDRAKFREEVVAGIEETFSNMGLEITAFQIKDINDDEGYFESLSAQEVADKKSKARQAQAVADKEATLVEAKNIQEAQKAKLEADKLIAQNQRDTDLAKAEYTAEVKKQQAVADNAYKIAEVEQQQYVNEKLVKTNETQYQATIITKQKADAQALVIDSKAKAEQIQIETEAQANQTKVLAEANSEKITKEGKAQADAQKALAEALEKNGQYALQKAIIDALPQIADSFAQSVANIDSLTVFDGADGVGRQSVAGLSETLSFVKQATGIDLADYMQKQAVGTRTIEGQVPVTEEPSQE